MFVEFDVTIGDAFDDFVGHFRNRLSFFSLETVVHQPFANKLLGELTLGFALFETLFIAFCIEIATGVGRVDFVHQIDGAVVLSKLVFGVNENQSALGSDFGATLEQGQGVFFEHSVFLWRYQSAREDFLL